MIIMSKVAPMHDCMQLKIFCEYLHGADRRHDIAKEAVDLTASFVMCRT